jgi:CBS domain containing-hemolysin-like protein
MDTSVIASLIAIPVLVVANAFFVATEFAMVAVRKTRLEQLAASGHPTASAARDVVRHLDAYIAACQLGITMASLALGWIGEPTLAGLLEPPLGQAIGPYAPAAAHAVVAVCAFALITGFQIVLGELAPKGLALQRTEAVMLWVARPIQLFHLIFRWPVALLTLIGNGVLRLAGLEPATGREMAHSVEELRLLVTGSEQAGEVEATEARIARRAFTFADVTAGALMTPRIEFDAVPLAASLEELLAHAASNAHSRLPVYEGSLDSIVGILNVRDLFKARSKPEAFELRALLRTTTFVPETKPADDLLEELRAARQELAIVIDEYGGTAGLVTLEDLLQALVGRIEQEAPLGSQLLPPATAQRDADGSWVMDGLLRLAEFEEITGVHLPESAHEEVETLGGLVMAVLDRLPAAGDQVLISHRVLRVEQLDGRRVARLRLLPAGGSVGEVAVASSPSAVTS